MAPLMPLPGWNPPFQPLEKTPRAGARDPSCSQSASHRSPGYHSGHSNVRFWMWYGCDTGLHDVPRCSDFSDFSDYSTTLRISHQISHRCTKYSQTDRLTPTHHQKAPKAPCPHSLCLALPASPPIHPSHCASRKFSTPSLILWHASGCKKELHGEIKGRKFVSEPFSCNTADEDASSTNNASPLPSEQRCWRIPCPWCRIWWQHLNHWAARWYKAKHPQIHRFLPPMPW